MNFLAWKYRIYNYYQDKKMIIIINILFIQMKEEKRILNWKTFLKLLTITENIVESNNEKYTIEKSDRLEINEKKD